MRKEMEDDKLYAVWGDQYCALEEFNPSEWSLGDFQIKQARGYNSVGEPVFEPPDLSAFDAEMLVIGGEQE